MKILTNKKFTLFLDTINNLKNEIKNLKTISEEKEWQLSQKAGVGKCKICDVSVKAWLGGYYRNWKGELFCSHNCIKKQ